MRQSVRSALMLILFLSLVMTASAALARRPSSSSEELKQYMESLKKNPADRVLRERIIRLALSVKPAIPEDAERHMARGTAYAQISGDPAGDKKAIAEFEAATNAAPWFALAYYNLGVVQEKAGQYAEALQSLKFYLAADPGAKNARDVKNKIYELEVYAEDAPAPAPETAAPAKTAGLAGQATLDLEAEKQLKILKMPKDKKSKAPSFIGNWFFKEVIGGEDVTINAFDIIKNGNGDLVLVPPKRVADSRATINIFEITGKTLKVQMTWKMKSVVGYWKTETYVLNISDDSSKLTGSHNQQSVGGRNIDMDRVLFRQ